MFLIFYVSGGHWYDVNRYRVGSTAACHVTLRSIIEINFKKYNTTRAEVHAVLLPSPPVHVKSHSVNIARAISTHGI